jgi:uncharacterized coiled-coil protein SlyX
MSASVIGALRVNLGLDAAQFETGARRAKSASQQLQRDFARVAAAAAAVGAAIIGMARQAMTTIDAQAKLARAVGGTTIGLQALERAGNRAGVQQSELSAAVTRLNQVLGRAMIAGTGTEGVFRRLGLSAQQLAGMDIDERFMAIADAMRAAGMNTQEMAATLRELGIRQSSVITLIQSGSNEIRRSRDAVIDFGVAVSEIDAAQIERTNDAISEVGRVFEGLRNQIAVSIAPGLEMLANAFTDSARAGGMVHGIVRGLVAAVPRLLSYVTAAVGGFAAYRTVLLAVAAAKWAVVGASAALRTALIRIGLGAVIVLAGEAIYQFSRVAESVGGLGRTFALLGEVVAAVFGGIIQSAQAIPVGLQSAWAAIYYDFLKMIQRLRNSWGDFLADMADGIRESGLNIGGVMDGVADRLAEASARTYRGSQRMAVAINDAMTAAADTSDEYSRRSSAAWDRTSAAMEALRAAIDETGQAAEEQSGTVTILGDALEDVGGGGRSAAAGAREMTEAMRRALGIIGRMNEESVTQEQVIAALRDLYAQGAISADQLAEAIRRVGEEMGGVNSQANETEAAFESAFVSFVSGAASAREALASLARDMARLFAQRAFQQLFAGSGIFSWLAPAIPAAAAIESVSVPMRASTDFRAPPESRAVSKAMPQLTLVAPDWMTFEGVQDLSLNVVKQATPNIIRESVRGTYRANERSPLR